MFKIKLIPEWRKAYKYLSMIASFAGLVFCGVIEFYGSELPPMVYGCMFAVVMLSRVINQGDKNDDAD